MQENLELQEKQKMYRHSMSHILAKAVKQLYPNVKLAIGPAVDNGFYYDFDGANITPEDFNKIEEKMREIINKNEDFVRMELTKAEALEIFKDEPYKVELINELPEGETISAYKTGDDFVDLCRELILKKCTHVPTERGARDRLTASILRYGYRFSQVREAFLQLERESDSDFDRLYEDED